MTIEERIERLESTNRRYRLILTLLGVIAIFTVGISATQELKIKIPAVIKAKAFVVMDDDGNRLARLGHFEDTSALSLYDKSGAVVVMLTSEISNGVRAGVINTIRGGDPGAAMGSDPQGNGYIVTFDSLSTKSVTLGSWAPSGGGRVITHDRRGKPTTALVSTPQGGQLLIYNSKYKPVVTVTAWENGDGMVAVEDRNGNVKILGR